jgi:hypothetical protein
MRSKTKFVVVQLQLISMVEKINGTATAGLQLLYSTEDAMIKQ